MRNKRYITEFVKVETQQKTVEKTNKQTRTSKIISPFLKKKNTKTTTKKHMLLLTLAGSGREKKKKILLRMSTHNAVFMCVLSPNP